jgi:dUTP pyrophosphatase
MKATDQAACWDLSACLISGDRIMIMDEYNQNSSRVVKEESIQLYGGERMLVPTGLIFDIPPGNSLRIHPRSGLSIKKGISLINCQGVIDSDYYHETFVALINHTQMVFDIQHGDRIAQCELVALSPTTLEETYQEPQAKTNRHGGFGSTGLTP